MEIQEMYGKEWLSIDPDAKKIIWKDAIFHKVIIDGKIAAVRRLGKDKEDVLTTYRIYILPEFRVKAKLIMETSITHYLALGRYRISAPTQRVQKLLETKPKFKFEKTKKFWEVTM